MSQETDASLDKLLEDMKSVAAAFMAQRELISKYEGALQKIVDCDKFLSEQGAIAREALEPKK